ncbi:MAG: hypothetical protein HY996_11740 [Micrococcales bacterium]|nr:hypothetical protein [Micrococcales bacterium]
MSDTDRPRYGEYAPGYTPPAPGAASAPPDRQPAAPSEWAAPQDGPSPSGAPGQHGGPQGYGAPQWTAGPAGRPRRTWDVVLTVVLLALGLVGTGIALVYAGLFSDPAVLDEVFRQQGRGGFSGRAGAAPAVIVVSHLALLVIAVGLSILFLLKRLVAFWIPLVAGVIAAVVFWSALISIVLSDPGITSPVAG